MTSVPEMGGDRGSLLALVDEIDELYGQGEDQQVLAKAAGAWPERGTGYVPEHAEIARYARVSAWRFRRDEADVWQQRAIEAALGSSNIASLSLSMQLYFYRAVDEERFADAHRVLDHMKQLAELPTEGERPQPDLVQRILAERRAYALRSDERWEESIAWYQTALGLSPEGRRGRAKVQGGLELATWLAGGSDEEAAAAFEDLVARSVAWPDVHDAAAANLSAARQRDRSASVPFDTV